MKRIIELEEAPFVQHFENGIGETVYRVRGFNNIVFNKSDIDELEPYKEQDCEKIWDIAKKLALGENDGYSIEEIRKMFGVCVTRTDVFRCYTVSEVLDKVNEYEYKVGKEKTISAGDVMRQYLDMFCKGRSCTGCVLHDFTCGNGTHFLSKKHPMPDEEVRRAYAEVMQKMVKE